MPFAPRKTDGCPYAPAGAARCVAARQANRLDEQRRTAKAKGLLRAEKGGHTGTLDPLATGLLPLCFGAATKFSQVSLDADKRYVATLRLGQRTSTGDAEGEIVEERDLDGVDRAAIDAACARFTGSIQQRPPLFSALKHQGKALYEYARAGIEIERAARSVDVHHIHVVDWQAAALVIDVACSKGTYIRTLAEEIGAALGLRCTPFGAAPHRLRCAGCRQRHHDGRLQALEEPARQSLLLPADRCLLRGPKCSFPPPKLRASPTACGARSTSATRPAIRVYSATPRTFLGTAPLSAGELIPSRLLSPTELQALA
jgi:tRNA pseudouridine55 synthase